MKKLLFLMVLIIGIIAVIGACSKSDDSSTAATATCAGMPVATVSTCSDTASGSITGLDNSSLSGVYDPYHAFGISGTAGVDNTTGCISAASLVATLGGPTGTASVMTNMAVTSSSSMATRHKYFSDTSCSTELASISFVFTDVTVGDNVTGLSTTVTGKSGTYPSSATKVSYTQSCTGMKASTDAGATFLTAAFGSAGVSPTVGTTHSCTTGGDTTNAFMKLDNESAVPAVYGALGGGDNGTTFLHWDDAATTDWTSGVETLFTLP